MMHALSAEEKSRGTEVFTHAHHMYASGKRHEFQTQLEVAQAHPERCVQRLQVLGK